MKRLAALEEKLKVRCKPRLYISTEYPDGRVEWKDGREPPPESELREGDIVAYIRYVAPSPVPDGEPADALP